MNLFICTVPRKVKTGLSCLNFLNIEKILEIIFWRLRNKKRRHQAALGRGTNCPCTTSSQRVSWGERATQPWTRFLLSLCCLICPNKGQIVLARQTPKIVDLVTFLSAVRDDIPKKSFCSFGFCPNEGRGGPCPNFLSPFHKCIFGQ